MNNIREKFYQFMQGRYGYDSFSRFLIGVWIFLAVLNLIFRSIIIYVLELLLCAYLLFRALSRNTVKRQRENARYYDLSQRFLKRVRHLLQRFKERKTYRFFKCPQCHADIRMPRKAGKFNIRCPRCQA